MEILHKPFFISICISLGVGQSKHTIKPYYTSMFVNVCISV